MGGAPRYPDFFILGAAKCGTTSLHVWLEQHPDILMSRPKEPFFFEAEYERGLDFYWGRYFAHWKGERLIGESRHRNLYFSHIPQRIKDRAPEARFILVFRDPVARAHSHWWHWFRTGRDELYFEDALREDLRRIEAGEGIATPAEIARYAAGLDRKGKGPYRTYLDSGYYAEQLARYQRLFDRGRFKILILEEIGRDPRRVLGEVFEFLGVDPAPASRIECLPENPSKLMRLRPALRWAGRRLASLRPSRRGPRAPLFLWKKPDMRPSTRAWLGEHYAPHNRALEAMLGRAGRIWD